MHFRRQRNRAGGPSGAKATTSTGWGGSNKVSGRAGELAFRRFGPCFDSRRGDRSGAAFALGLMSVALHETQHARAAKRVVRRSSNSLSSRSASRASRATKSPCAEPKLSARGTARRSASKPKPGSSGSASERAFHETAWQGFSDRASAARSRPTAGARRRRREKNSPRKNARLGRAAPERFWPHGSDRSKRPRWTRFAPEARRSGVRPCNRRRTKGVMRKSSRPSRRSILRGKSAPKRAAKARDGREARSPMVFRPARTQGEQAVLLDLQCGERQARDRRRRLSARENAALRKTRQSARAIGRRRSAARAENPSVAMPLSAPDKRPSSPPNRCAQPVTSRTRPCGSSKAVRGV